ncbi:MAG: OmpH family outer membrane protein [Acidobacteria bacterium]|nr:OmpH family outer membrane protein [Acidobacteriota bacterium]
MKHVVWIIAMAVFLTPALGQQAAKPAPTKIGVIDFVRALSETAEGKKEFSAVQEWAVRQGEALRNEQAEYNTLRSRYMQEQLKMAPEARAGMEHDLQDREVKLRRLQEDLEQDLAERRQTIINRLGRKMQELLIEYAQQNDYLAVLVAQEGMFAYVAEAGDLSGEMAKLYDAKYPVSGAAAK